MMPRSVVLRAAAHRDVAEGGTEVALGFIDALEDAFRHVADNPGSGSPRYGQELNLPGLRSWPLKSYPHIVFYMMGRGQIDVWRVLRGRRDIPAWMRES